MSAVATLLVAGSPEQWRADARTYLERSLNASEPPTVYDYDRWNPHDESETELESKVCAARGWPEKSAQCSKYAAEREAQPKKHPSLFYCWLRSRLGVSRQISVVGIAKQVRDVPGFPIDLIDVRYGSHVVRLARPVYELNPELREFTLEIREIDGTSAWELLDSTTPEVVNRLTRRCS